MGLLLSRSNQTHSLNLEPGTDLNQQGTKNSKAAEVFAGPNSEPGTQNHEPSALRWYVKEQRER